MLTDLQLQGLYTVTPWLPMSFTVTVKDITDKYNTLRTPAQRISLDKCNTHDTSAYSTSDPQCFVLWIIVMCS